MSTDTTRTHGASSAPAVQLALALAPAGIDPAQLPPQLRVSSRTRTIGRAGIAEARAILAAQRERRTSLAA
jgi:hypothetical protein